jgi:cob(I)alamin adenosyltransferase
MLDFINNHFIVLCLIVGVAIGIVIAIMREVIGYFTKSNEILEEIKLIKFQLNDVSFNLPLNSNQNYEIKVEKINELMQKIDEIDAFITDYQMFDYDELDSKVNAICNKFGIEI